MNDDEFQRLLDAEPPLVFGEQRNKMLLMAFLDMFLPAGVSGLASQGILATLTKLRHPEKSSLTLNTDGFVITTLSTDSFSIPKFTRKKAYYWKDVSELKQEKGNIILFKADTISYNDSPVHISEELPEGYTDWFKNIYAIDTLQLAQLMNYWRERALRAE